MASRFFCRFDAHSRDPSQLVYQHQDKLISIIAQALTSTRRRAARKCYCPPRFQAISILVFDNLETLWDDDN